MTQPQHSLTFRDKKKTLSSVSSILHKKADQTMSTSQSDHRIQLFSVSALRIGVILDCHYSAEPQSAQHILPTVQRDKNQTVATWHFARSTVQKGPNKRHHIH